jgi:hypothetical protein
MIDGHTWIERGMCVTGWSDFPCRVYIDLNRHQLAAILCLSETGVMYELKNRL